ncbi:MAG TPA: hypothetical protein PK228_17350, partial [Saprospiraceae bacterium]|nr:hypothetical protein [Saprospiraceae bacterium]
MNNELKYSAGFIMCSRQITGTEQELIRDLTTCKSKGLLEKFDPLLFIPWVMSIQPVPERPMFVLQPQDFLGVK